LENINEHLDTLLEVEQQDLEGAQEEHQETCEEPYTEVVITPIEDPGPRFIEATEAPEKEHEAPTPRVQQIKRHPRNIPKFSRWS